MDQIGIEIKSKLPKWVIFGLAILVLGALLSFLFLAKTQSLYKALLIGFFNSTLLVIVVFLVNKVVVIKLLIFNPIQQWTLRTFIYTISISAVYLSGLLFQTVVLTPNLSFQELLSENIWSTFVAFISSPLDPNFSDSLFREEFRAVLIPFFAVIVLIGLVSLLGSYVEMKWLESKRRQAVEKAELTALKAQIEPHFLFNSLNTVASQIKNDPENAEKLVLKLSDIIRYFFDTAANQVVPLKNELDFLRKYLDLMQARFDQRLQIEWQQIVKNEQIKVPALILQPIIENALKHGWRDGGNNLKITIIIQEEDNEVSFKIRDNGQGMERKLLESLPLTDHALFNIIERLRLLFKKNDLLKIESDKDQGTLVSILIPKGKL